MRFAVGAFALLAVAGSVSAQCDGSCQCEVDSCFEALAGGFPFPPQPRVEDCRDFLWESVTWGSATRTVTSLVVSGVVTDTAVETVFVTVSEGTTSIETITNIVTATQTVTSGDGTFTGKPSTTVVAPLRRRRRRKRQNAVPSYASDCGGGSGYSSACTCIGVAPDGTRWIEVPTVTTTVTSGNPVTETVSETETITTTVVGDFAGATETETLVKTATQEVFQPLYTSFVLQLTNDDVNGAYKGAFLRFEPDPSNSNMRRLKFGSDIAGATLYKADGSGRVTTNTGGIGFAQDNTGIGPQMWQESAAGKTGWTDYIFTINEDRILIGEDINGGRPFFAVDASNDNFRVFAYIDNLILTGCSGPLIIVAVPQDTTTVPAALAKNIVVRAKTTGNDMYNDQYLGTQVQGSQPFPRVRFYASINDAITFKADPINGNIFGPSNAPFSAQEPTDAQPRPFLLGGRDATHLTQHFAVQWPSTDIVLTYPPDTRYLGAVRITGDPTDVPFFRIHSSATVLADEIGPLDLEAVEV